MSKIDLDLDLVELRCRLRGWTCARFVEDGADYVSVECRYGGELILGGNGWVGRESGWDTPAHKRIEAMLLGPRWTLDRLLSEPPEGWDLIVGRDDLFFQWGPHLGWHRAVSVRVSRATCRVSSEDISLGLQGKDRAEAHQAAAELALILAEVEP